MGKEKMKKTVLAIMTSLLVLSFFSVFTPKARSILPPTPPNPLVKAGFAYRNPEKTSAFR